MKLLFQIIAKHMSFGFKNCLSIINVIISASNAIIM